MGYVCYSWVDSRRIHRLEHCAVYKGMGLDDRDQIVIKAAALIRTSDGMWCTPTNKHVLYGRHVAECVGLQHRKGVPPKRPVTMSEDERLDSCIQ